jgi:hypothetical protein
MSSHLRLGLGGSAGLGGLIIIWNSYWTEQKLLILISQSELELFSRHEMLETAMQKQDFLD